MNIKIGANYGSLDNGYLYGLNLGLDKMYKPFNNGFEIGFGGDFDILSLSSSSNSYGSAFLGDFKGIIGYDVVGNPFEFKFSYGKSYFGDSLSNMESVEGFVYRAFTDSPQELENGLFSINFILKPF